MIELKRINVIVGSKFLKKLHTTKPYIIIDTIEGNLLPTQQYEHTLDFIKFINSNSYEYILTTNSPYTLTTLNNSILAGQILKLNNSKLNDKLFEIIYKNQIVNIKEWTVLTMIDDVFVNLIDEETGLIDCEVIDEASNIIDLQFQSIINLTN